MGSIGRCRPVGVSLAKRPVGSAAGCASLSPAQNAPLIRARRWVAAGVERCRCSLVDVYYCGGVLADGRRAWRTTNGQSRFDDHIACSGFKQLCGTASSDQARVQAKPLVGSRPWGRRESGTPERFHAIPIASSGGPCGRFVGESRRGLHRPHAAGLELAKRTREL